MRFIITVVTMAIMSSGCNTSTIQNGIPNLHQVSASCWRGGQPTEGGWIWLAAHGITNVVKLNEWSEGDDSPARELGLTVHNHAIDLWHQLILRPNSDDLHNAVNDIRGRTYVHCEHGQDRTGIVAACYRLKQGWTKEAAEKEMMDLGFHVELQGLYGRWQQQQPKDWK